MSSNEYKDLTKQIYKDDKAFEKLYDSYFTKLFNYLLPKVNYNKHIAEDLASTAFEKAFSNRQRFKWQGVSFISWIHKIAGNVLIDYYRKSSTKLDKPLEHDNIEDNTNNIEASVIAEDLNSNIRKIINQLGSKEREIINLKFYEGYTNKQIAAELNLTETNVGTILYRAISKLRKNLSTRDF